MCYKIAQLLKYFLQKSEDLSLTPRMHIKMPCVGSQEMLRVSVPSIGYPILSGQPSNHKHISNIIGSEQVIFTYLGMCVCIFVHFICMRNDKEIEAMNLRESKGEDIWKRLERGKGRGKLCDYILILKNACIYNLSAGEAETRGLLSFMASSW